MPIKPIEVFQFLRPEYKFIVMNRFRHWIAYKTQPWLCETNAYNCLKWSDSMHNKKLGPLEIDYTGDWKDSLFERPRE